MLSKKLPFGASAFLGARCKNSINGSSAFSKPNRGIIQKQIIASFNEKTAGQCGPFMEHAFRVSIVRAAAVKTRLLRAREVRDAR